MWANWGTVENARDQIQRQQRYFTAQMCTYGAQYAIFIFFLNLHWGNSTQDETACWEIGIIEFM